MLYREIIAVCSQIHTKHINTLCGQNVELLNVKLAVHIVTTGPTVLITATVSHIIHRYRRLKAPLALCSVRIPYEVERIPGVAMSLLEIEPLFLCCSPCSPLTAVTSTSATDLGLLL